jgi:hypothetical protein
LEKEEEVKEVAFAFDSALMVLVFVFVLDKP